MQHPTRESAAVRDAAPLAGLADVLPLPLPIADTVPAGTGTPATPHPLVGYLLLAPAGTDPETLLNAVRAGLPTTAVPGGGPPAAPPQPDTDSRDAARDSGVTLDTTARTVTVDGRALDLTYLEYELLALLMTHPQRVYSRDQLVTTVWGYGPVGDRRTVDVHIARLRRKLGAPHRARIVTVHRVGYKYVDERN